VVTTIVPLELEQAEAESVSASMAEAAEVRQAEAIHE
jgi:hypothetical protein